MSTYIVADMDLKFKNDKAKEARSAVFNSTFFVYYNEAYDITEDNSIDDMLSAVFNEVSTAPDGTVMCSYYDECGYSFSSDLEDFFKELVAAGFVEDGSTLYESSDDDGGWRLFCKVVDGKAIEGHDVTVTMYDNELHTGKELLSALKLAVKKLESMDSETLEKTAESLRNDYGAQEIFNMLVKETVAA